jgi:hypothetical protein
MDTLNQFELVSLTYTTTQAGVVAGLQPVPHSSCVVVIQVDKPNSSRTEWEVKLFQVVNTPAGSGYQIDLVYTNTIGDTSDWGSKVIPFFRGSDFTKLESFGINQGTTGAIHHHLDILNGLGSNFECPSYPNDLA